MERMPGAAPIERRFRYVLDPVFLGAVGLYLLVRFVVRPATDGTGGFFQCYANDLLCVAFWLPPILWVARGLHLRRHDAPPTVGEMALYVAVWSWLFEFATPWPRGSRAPGSTADPWDVAAYAAGAVAAGLLWRSPLRAPAATRLPGTQVALHAAAALVVVAGAMVVTVGTFTSDPWQPRFDRLADRRLLTAVASAVETYRTDHGRLPERLDDLPLAGTRDDVLRAIAYRREGIEPGFVLTHLGADQRPGGDGPDADLFHPPSLQPEWGWRDHALTPAARRALADGSVLGVLCAAAWLVVRRLRRVWWRPGPGGVSGRDAPPALHVARFDLLVEMGSLVLALVSGAFVLSLQYAAEQSAH